ncbi:hypothetical protein [Arthrobacter sp. H14]|uniref:hypothetical protein n=1 Tax=Arthrobacter sp. H14 TaxID=1312959 RepID=UPI00047ED819|nr:hypothetical protein [Arthrobacter sp. H14]
MATITDQDRKKKTLPLQTYEIPQDEQFDGEVIDGEILEDGDPVQSSRAEPGPGKQKPAGSKKSGERTASPGDRRRQQRKQSDQQRKQQRSQTADPLGSTSTRKTADTPTSKLRHEVDDAGKRFMEEVRKADILAAKKTSKERNLQLTGIHKGYVSMMVLSCIQPLSQGVNPQSVMSVVGMGSAMWMMSPNFRNQVGDFAESMKETITSKIDERRQSQIDKVMITVGAKGEAGQRLSQKWKNKLERAERAERGDRDAYTAQSAGMTEVALTENAYAAMRVEGADVSAIADNHFSMLKDLYAHAYDDGVEAHEVATSARMVVGQRLGEEPELASVFDELSHGQFTKSDPREVRLSGTDETVQVWTGEFESRLGQPIEAGSFGVRQPMDGGQHQKAISETITGDMIALTSDHGVDGLNMGVVGYASAWGLKERPDYDGMLAMDNPLGERLRTSRIMLNTMNSDNISSSEQQRIYSNAYVDALDNISLLYPEIEQEWAVKFGANWRENMRDFVSNPQHFMGGPGGESAAEGEDTWEAGSAWEAGPAGDGKENSTTGQSQAQPQQPGNPAAEAARKHRNARINQNYNETAKTGVHGLGSDASDFRDQDFELGG